MRFDYLNLTLDGTEIICYKLTDRLETIKLSFQEILGSDMISSKTALKVILITLFVFILNRNISQTRAAAGMHHPNSDSIALAAPLL